MKLYRVHLEFETVILAESEDAAIKQAESIIKDSDDPASFVAADEIKTLMEIPPGWDKGCRPWGETDPMDRTVGEILIANA